MRRSAYADALGLAFQIRDDMLDVIGDEATFGKPIGSDKAEKKTTFVDLLGLAACEREVVRLTDEAISALGLFGRGKRTSSPRSRTAWKRGTSNARQGGDLRDSALFCVVHKNFAVNIGAAYL